MVIFSSLAEALREGFRWHSFSKTEKLHIVEMDRPSKRGLRVKALAFAQLSAEESAALEAEAATHLAEVPHDIDATEQPEAAPADRGVYRN